MNIKMKDCLGIFCRASFMPAAILPSGTRPKRRCTHFYLRRLCYFTCNWSTGAETSLLL